MDDLEWKCVHSHWMFAVTPCKSVVLFPVSVWCVLASETGYQEGVALLEPD